MTSPNIETAVGMVDQPKRWSRPATTSIPVKLAMMPTTTAFWSGRGSAVGPACIRRSTVAGSSRPRNSVGTSDTTVGQNPVTALKTQYTNNGVTAANLEHVVRSGASHTFPTDFDSTGNNGCGSAASPYISNCSYDGAKAVRIQGEEIKVAARIRYLDEYSGHADGPELARWIGARRPIHRALFLTHGEELALKGLSERIAERIVPTAQIFTPLLDDIYELSTVAPTPLDVTSRRRLAPEAVVNLDWHNDMSKLILDISARVEATADDRARGVIVRRLRRALAQE